MENYRKSGWFLFFIAFLGAFSVIAYAETVVEEKKAAANYDETFPAPGESRADEEVSSVSQAPAAVVVPLANATPEDQKKTAREPV
jgi:hypothetical protein